MERTTLESKPLLLITGSSGFIGRALIERFAPTFRIVALDVQEPENRVEHTTFYRCDLTDSSSVEQALQQVYDEHGGSLTSVIHLAAYYDFSGEPDPLYKALTVEGTKRLLKELQKFEVEQFIFSSSLLVMEPAEEQTDVIAEDAPLDAEWAYPQSKLEAEKIVENCREDIPAVILRIAGVYDDNCHSLPISQHIRRIYEKQLESVFFPGDAERGQAFVHIEDLAECFFQTVGKRKTLDSCEVFLIAEPHVLSHQELQDDLGMLLHGKEWPTIRMPKILAKAGAWAKERLLGQDEFIKPWMIDLADDHYPVDIAHAQAKLEWRPVHHVRAALPSMVHSLRENPAAFYSKHKLQPPEEFPESGNKSMSSESSAANL